VDFRSRTEDDWKQHKEGVLRRARLVGSMATTLTIVEAVKRHYMPTEVDQRSADLAGYLIAKVKIADFPKAFGHFCQSYLLPRRVQSRP
jgi:hypothetical protein